MAPARKKQAFFQRVTRRVAACVAISILGLAGCGQKGPLYLPEDDARNKKSVATEHVEHRAA